MRQNSNFLTVYILSFTANYQCIRMDRTSPLRVPTVLDGACLTPLGPKNFLTNLKLQSC